MESEDIAEDDLQKLKEETVTLASRLSTKHGSRSPLDARTKAYSTTTVRRYERQQQRRISSQERSPNSQHILIVNDAKSISSIKSMTDRSSTQMKSSTESQEDFVSQLMPARPRTQRNVPTVLQSFDFDESKGKKQGLATASPIFAENQVYDRKDSIRGFSSGEQSSLFGSKFFSSGRYLARYRG